MEQTFIRHENDWWWGHATTFIKNDGMASVELSIASNEPDYGYVQTLIVHESVRRQGIARQMMQMLEEEALRRGVKILYLSTSKSKWMKDWYARLGYIDKGEQDGTEGHCIQMQKTL